MIYNSTMYGGFVLFILTVILVYSVIYNTQNKLLLKKDSKTVSVFKTLLISIFISIIPTASILYISIRVDKLPTKNKK
jgi:hypothetical protein